MVETLENVRVLSPLVLCVLGQNPGPHTLQGTNTYLIGNGKKRILLDCGEGKQEYYPLLQSVLKENDIEIQEIICSHWHRDHICGIPNLIELYPTLQASKFPDSHDKEILPDFDFKSIHDLQEFKCDGATLTAMYTPGHSDDHISFYFSEEEAIFSGDCILGEGTTAFQDLSLYMNSLNIILNKKPKRIYPGHGPVIENGIEKIEYYLAHRNKREEQIFEVLQTEKDITIDNIVKKLYPDIPEQVIPSAKRNVIQHLEKLKKENRISSLPQ